MHLLNFSRDVSQNYILRGVNWFRADTKIENKRLLGHRNDNFRRKLYFHVIADNEKMFSRLVNRTADWPEQFRKKVKFMMHDVWYPPV